MHFYFDESGDFALPKPGEHAVAVTCGVAVSNAARDGLAARFAEFEAARAPAERRNGEVKGRLLARESRAEFCEMLASTDGVSVTPVTTDLGALDRADAEGFPAAMRAKLEALAETMRYPTTRADVRGLARRFGRLHHVQARRLFSWATCFRFAIEHALLFLSEPPHADSWLDVRFVVDPTQKRDGGKEARIFEVMVLGWVKAWSVREPFALVVEIHTPDHPFVRTYDTAAGIDIGKLVRDNLAWEPSHTSWGVRLADIAAGIVYAAARDPGDAEAVRLYGSLMRSSFYGPLRGPGLVAPPPGLPDEAVARYSPLVAAMRRA